MGAEHHPKHAAHLLGLQLRDGPKEQVAGREPEAGPVRPGQYQCPAGPGHQSLLLLPAPQSQPIRRHASVAVGPGWCGPHWLIDRECGLCVEQASNLSGQTNRLLAG